MANMITAIAGSFGGVGGVGGEAQAIYEAIDEAIGGTGGLGLGGNTAMMNRHSTTPANYLK
jgi:hypothetical protein